MTAEIKFGKEEYIVENDQSRRFGGVTIFSQEHGTWVHPVNGCNVNGDAKVKEGAVGLYAPGSFIETGNGLKVEHRSDLGA